MNISQLSLYFHEHIIDLTKRWNEKC